MEGNDRLTRSQGRGGIRSERNFRQYQLTHEDEDENEARAITRRPYEGIPCRDAICNATTPTATVQLPLRSQMRGTPSRNRQSERGLKKKSHDEICGGSRRLRQP